MQDLHRLERDYLAGRSGRFELERGRRVLRMLRVPFGHLPLEVRVKRVEIPSPVRPTSFPEDREGVPHPRIGRVPERTHEIESREEVGVVVDRVVKAVPRWTR